MNCSVEDCIKPARAKGYCSMHYTRLRKHGDLTIVIKPRPRQKQEQGAYSHPEYRTWKNMKARCYYSKDSRYERYGGRGITVCDRWIANFWNFVEDMGPKPTPKHTLDRKDTDGNYEPSNCKWSTVREQNANRSNSNTTIGVSYDKSRSRWWAMLKVNGQLVYRKSFSTENAAIQARKEAELEFLVDYEHKHDTMQLEKPTRQRKNQQV